MKFYILFTFTIFLNVTAFSQIFYKSFNSQEFQDLQANGVTYIKTGNELDAKFEECLMKYWKSTKVRVIDPKKEEYKLNDHDVIISENIIITKSSHDVGPSSYVDASYPEDLLCIYSASILNRKEKISKYNILGYVALDGYNQGADPASVNFYLPFSISGLSNCVEKVIQQKIAGIAPFFNETIADAINVNAVKLKSKTLLIVDNTIGYVNTADLDKNGIKYHFIEREEIAKSIKDYETSGYCLLFFTHKSFIDISIYDMLDKSLMYTWYYHTGNAAAKKFDKKDIKKINSYH